MDSGLPPCEWRVIIPQDDHCYCRHAKIVSDTGIIHRMACRVCPLRLVDNPSPRPVLTDDQLRTAAESHSTMPSMATQLWNLGRAVTGFIADGLQTVGTAEYAERLSICEPCEHRVGDRCAKCGCHLTLKAQGRVFECPENRWPRSEP